MLDLQAVETLREVARRGSFSAAATALHYTQPAISRRVAQLEREIGLPLVVRSRKGIRLTPAGELVVAHADAVRLRLLRLEEELKEVVGGTRVVARIAGFPTAFIDLIPTVVRRLRYQVPHAEITLERCGHEDAIGRLRRGDVDIALVFRGPQAERGDADLRVIDLGAQPMHALLPKEHSLRSTKAIKLSSLRNERWIVGSVDEPSSIIVAACRAAGFEPQIAFTTDDALATQGLVAAGLGVSLSSPWEASVLRSDVVLRPVTQPSPKRRIAAMVAQPAAPAAELLLDLTRSCVRELAQRRVAIAR